jgi:hypothetical protein
MSATKMLAIPIIHLSRIFTAFSPSGIVRTVDSRSNGSFTARMTIKTAVAAGTVTLLLSCHRAVPLGHADFLLPWTGEKVEFPPDISIKTTCGRAGEEGKIKGFVKSARIVAAEVANGFVLAALTLEVYEVYKPAPVYEHMKEQTQPCQHWGTSWSRALKKCGPRCRVFKQCCLHPDVTDITEHGDASTRHSLSATAFV